MTALFALHREMIRLRKTCPALAVPECPLAEDGDGPLRAGQGLNHPADIPGHAGGPVPLRDSPAELSLPLPGKRWRKRWTHPRNRGRSGGGPRAIVAAAGRAGPGETRSFLLLLEVGRRQRKWKVRMRPLPLYSPRGKIPGGGGRAADSPTPSTTGTSGSPRNATRQRLSRILGGDGRERDREQLLPESAQLRADLLSGWAEKSPAPTAPFWRATGRAARRSPATAPRWRRGTTTSSFPWPTNGTRRRRSAGGSGISSTASAGRRKGCGSRRRPRTWPPSRPSRGKGSASRSSLPARRPRSGRKEPGTGATRATAGSIPPSRTSCASPRERRSAFSSTTVPSPRPWPSRGCSKRGSTSPTACAGPSPTSARGRSSSSTSPRTARRTGTTITRGRWPSRGPSGSSTRTRKCVSRTTGSSSSGSRRPTTSRSSTTAPGAACTAWSAGKATAGATPAARGGTRDGGRRCGKRWTGSGTPSPRCSNRKAGRSSGTRGPPATTTSP
jgi:hypothetical protein